jgi:hypothetical protein
MRHKYEAVEGAKSPKDALAKPQFSDACQDYFQYRTYEMSVLNETQNRFKIVFFQALDETGAPDDFISDTGVFVGAVDLQYRENAVADPCEAGGTPKPIQATRSKCTFKAITPDGYEDNQYCDDIVAPDGYYYKTPGWRYYYETDAKGTRMKVEPLAKQATKRQAVPRKRSR